MQQTVTSDSLCSSFVNTAPSTVSNCVVKDRVQNPLPVAGLSASTNGLSMSVGDLLLGAVSSSCACSVTEDSVSCCSVATTARCQSLSVSRSLSALGDSKSLCSRCSMSSVDLCPRLRTSTCHPAATSQPSSTPAPCTLISRAVALKEQLSIASESGCLSSDCSVLAGSSLTQAPLASVRTLSVSSALNETSSVVSSAVSSYKSANVVSVSRSSPSTEVSECSGVVISHGNRSLLLPTSHFPGSTMQSVRPSSSAVLRCHNLTPSLLSSEVRSSTSDSRSRRVLRSATRCSSRQTPIVSSASVSCSDSVPAPGSFTVQIPPKPPELVASRLSPPRSGRDAGMSATSRSDRHFLDSFASLTPHLVLSSAIQPTRISSSSLCSSAVTTSDMLRTSSDRNPVTGSCCVVASSVPLSFVSYTSTLTSGLSPSTADTSIISSSISLSFCSENVDSPSFTLFSPQRQSQVNVASRASSQNLSSKFAAPNRTKLNNADNSASDFVCSGTASAVDGATEPVVMVASPSVDCHRHGNRENYCHVKTDGSVSADKASESVAMVTASLADLRHLSDKQLSSLTASSAITTVCEAVEPVVMVTASSIDSRCYNNSKTAGSVAMESVVTATTQAGRGHHGKSGMSGVAEMVPTASLQRKAKTVKLCSKVTTAVLQSSLYSL